MSENNQNREASARPAEAPGNNAANTSAPRKIPDETPNTSAQSTAPPPLRKQLSGNLGRVASPSPASSPRTSRNASPVRKDARPPPLTTPISTQPSAAAIQRALSAANSQPQLQPSGGSDVGSKVTRQPRSAGGPAENTPQWPTSPRLKSPPPSGPNSRRGSSTTTKKAEAVGPPNISVQSATPQSPTQLLLPKQNGDDAAKGNQLQVSGKGPSRGPSGKSTLETVQENSADDVKEPSPAAVAAAAELKPLTKLSDDEARPTKRERDLLEGEKVESGSESAGTKSPKKRELSQHNPRPKTTVTKSYASLGGSTKSRSGDGKQGMTVETETVPSVPQSALNVGDRSGAGRGDYSGSIRQKPSSEAMRPKKDRKKNTQKARSITQGTASSKADIFEQRVANAVDEANSSESDETFVYESNPPEPQRRARHHSRTPSVTSANSVADQQRGGIRNFGDVLDDSRRVAGKRSMKFSNNAFDPDSPEGKDGSVRSHTPRHFGRFGRGGSQQSMFDPDSPFTQASKLRSGQRTSRPGSPRIGQAGQQRSSGLFGKKQEPSYDFDAEVGDDERTPLVGTVRGPRSPKFSQRRSQRSPSIDEYYGVRRRGRCGRYSGCCLAIVVLVFVICSTMGFLVMSNRPLYAVEILQIENVLASEQELMLDLWVTAVNPNALAITVTDMDVNVFARSKHVGTGAEWRESELLAVERPQSRRKRRKSSAQQQISAPPRVQWWPHLPGYQPSHPSGGVDEGTDPPDDDDLERDGQTMLLGRIFDFDQPLTFEGSPLRRLAQNSTGELRLEKPGNKTESGGSERWERVLQYPFKLTVMGTLKYQLPISSRLQTVAVRGSVVVAPDDDGS